MPMTGLLDEVARDALQLDAGHSPEQGSHSRTPWVRIAAPRVCEICGTRSLTC